MKTVLLFLAALLLPAAASAYDACINGIYYNIVKKAKQATVTYGESTNGTYSGNVNIPATVEYDGVTCNVITIDKDAFRGCKLTSLSIPASITSIEKHAFYYAGSINQLHINDLAAWCITDLKDTGSSPFSCSEHFYVNGKEVKDLGIPTGVAKINDNVFYGAKMLNSITIPGSVTEIGAFAFNCYGHDYSKVTIDNRSLVAIGKGAFFYESPIYINIKELHITDLAAWCSNVMLYSILNDGSIHQEYNNPLITSEKFFVNGMEVTDLVIPNGVTNISAYAFYGAKMLTSVSIPNSVKEIGNYSFYGCASLKSANVPDGVEVINNVFLGCSSLKDLTIGRGVRSMIGVFDKLESLENIYISDLTGFCKIITDERNGSSRDPFHRMPPKQTTIKASSNSVNRRLFLNGQEVKNLVVPKDILETTEDMVYFVSSSDIFYIICDAFSYIASIESVTIPEETVPAGINCRIGYWGYTGFRNCPNLKSINNETNLTYLEIVDCDKLETLTLGKYTKLCEVRSCKELADVYCAAMPCDAEFGNDCQVEYATLHVPEILIEKYRTYSYNNYITWKDFGSIVDLKPGDPGYEANPDNTTISFADAAFGSAAIANWDFDGDGKLSKYEASLVTDLGTAFKGNTNIKLTEDLKYFTSIQEINDYAFSGCSGLVSVVIPDFVTYIGRRAFWNCDKMVSVTIPSSVKYIRESAFSECRKLTAVHISDLSAWCNISFVNSDSNPLYYAHHLYLNGEEVTELVIPNYIKRIGDNSFWGCTGLTSVTIPSSVTSIGWYAFEDCSGLTSVTIPNSVTSIGYRAFSGCSGLTSVTIPNSVTSIGEGAFSGCRGLTSVTIPNSVTSIGGDAFSGCNSLSSVHSKIEEPFAIDDNVFYYYGNSNNFTSATLYVPRGTKAKYQATDGWKNFTNIIETDFKDEPQGDVNGDNVVDVADIATIISVMASGSADASSASADVNGDGTVDVADIATVISIMAANARRLKIKD